ncbi:hypothetical protein K0I63_18975 [Shewanella rhizosphaerae]|uniref:hypothetical protein n=1 Tax=Shewanella rhizosphaerae TaxID=2864207 RepID=UPI001C655DC0|nr:hypothetical protein [Shewanella rhizosphaerae]QYK12778.1 hypothetical protein K0I63_18975 [Shewanella rhizosphaerae]
MWHLKYKEYEEESVRSDYEISKKYLDEIYGKTTPTAVYLRKNQPIDPSTASALNSPLCEPIPERDNEFAIYLTLDANSNMFLGQLAHEVAHLKNAHVSDLYIEGINTNFARKLHSHLGREDEWSEWEEHYRAGKDPLYADTYFLIKELEEEISHDFIRKAFSHLTLTKGKDDKPIYVINLKQWLNEIEGEERAKAVNIFKKHQAKILSHKSGDYDQTQMLAELEA